MAHGRFFQRLLRAVQACGSVRRTVRWATTSLVLGGSLWAASPASAADLPAAAPVTASAVGAARTGPHIEPARARGCVADPATMRREHMRLLRHQRDDTVRAGLRGGAAGLKQCVACHASRSSGSVAAAPTDFCISCHTYAGVRIDCFECHASRP